MFTVGDPGSDAHDSYMTVESKNGLVVNKPRIITRTQQPTFETCTLAMDYKLQSAGGGEHLVNCCCDHILEKVHGFP